MFNFPKKELVIGNYDNIHLFVGKFTVDDLIFPHK